MGNAEISCCTRKNQKSKAAVSNLNVSSKGPASTLAKKTEVLKMSTLENLKKMSDLFYCIQ